MKAKSYIPEGKHNLVPHMVLRNADKAIEFYVKAFAAKEVMRMHGPDGKSIIYASLQFGDSTISLCEEMPQCESKSPETLGGTNVAMFLYVPDVDASFKKAVDAGCTVKMPVMDMFWGDRFSCVIDPFGAVWNLSTHVEDLTVDEIAQRQESFCAQMAAAK